jgi:hypothetical protein
MAVENSLRVATLMSISRYWPKLPNGGYTGRKGGVKFSHQKIVVIKKQHAGEGIGDISSDGEQMRC